MQFKNILVVCVGNICRSPMADNTCSKKITLSSPFILAGISGMIGYAADDKAQLCMQRFEIDMSSTYCQKSSMPSYLTSS